MRLHNRIFHILIAIGLIFVAVLLLALGKEGADAVALIIGISMLVSGIRSLVAFISKTRFMVGGRTQLYMGILTMDLGLLIISSFSGSTYLILLYLLGMLALTGGIGAARAMEAKKHGAPWKIRMLTGVLSLAMMLLGLIFFRDPETVVDIYSISLFISAVEHFYTAFRRTRAVSIA